MLKAFLIWGVVLILQAVVVVLFIPPNLVVNAAFQEEAVLNSTLGPELATSIASRARETFQSTFVETGIMAESFAVLVPSEASKRNSAGMETLLDGAFQVVQRRLESAWNLVFIGIQRFYSITAWLPLMLPFIIAAAYDGATIRKIKLLSFGMSSAAVYGAAMHALVVLLFFPLYYAVWPFSAPPLLVPMWLITTALVLRSLISNMHRM